MNYTDLQATIDIAWEHRAKLDPTNSPELKAAVDAGGGQGLNDFLDGLGLGIISQHTVEQSGKLYRQA